MTQRWDAARAASRRSIRAYKPVGPVGEDQGRFSLMCGPDGYDGVRSEIVCQSCGYHVCSCKPQFERAQSLGHYDSMSLQTAFGELKVIADPRVTQGGICVFKADAEAKPFRDALDARIKALMGLMPYASYELLAAALDEDKT